MTTATDTLKDPLKWSLAFIVAFGILVNIVSIYILFRCRRIARTIRVAFFHILVFETLPLITSLIFEFSKDSPEIRIEIFRYDKVSIFVTWTMTTLLAIERVFILESPRLYMRYVTKCSLAIICGVMWTLTGANILSTIFMSLNIDTYSKTRMQKICWFGISLNLLNAVIITCCYTRVAILCRRHLTRILQNTPQAYGQAKANRIPLIPKSTRVLVFYTFLFVMMNVPLCIEKVLDDCDMHPERAYGYYLVLLNHVVNPFIYVLRFKECRLQIFLFLQRFPGCSSIGDRISELKADVYSLPGMS